MTSLTRDKRFLMHHDGLSPAEADEMAYFEFIEYKKLLAEDLKHQAKQADEQNAQMKQHTPKKPNFKIPSFKAPKF